MLTRRPVLDFGARAYVDVPYLALVLGALLVETRRPRAGAPVLVAARRRRACIRPEAWLFSAAYLVWLWIGGVARPAAVGRWPPPRRCCGRWATSSSPAIRCTR